MPSLTAKDRAPLCLFSYEDGRRCRTPRISSHPHFCFYHAQKDAQSLTAESLAKDLDYFFSGDYLSACDLSTALGRLIPAVIRGDIKPRLARTVAYMFQTQLQAIHLSQHEYINAFSTDGWRKAVRTSVNGNHDYLFPPDPDENSNDDAEPPAQVPAQPTSPTPVGAGLARPAQPQQPNASSSQTPSRPQQSAPARPQPPSADRPSPANVEAALSVARELFPARLSSTPAQSAAPATNHATLTPQPSSSSNQPDTQTSQPENAMPPGPPRPQPRPATPNRDPYAVHFDHNYRLRVDGKLF